MKIVKKVIYIVAITIMSLIIYSTSVRANTTLKVTADTLNLREKASTSSDILTLLSKGDTCELIEEDGDWYKVKYKTYTGYVSKEYAEKEDTSTNQQTSNEAEGENIQNENNSEVNDADVQVTGKIAKKATLKLVPLIYSSDIATLSKNDEVIVISELNGWSYIQTETLTGWVRGDSITGKKSVSDNATVEQTDKNKDDISNQKDTNTIVDNNTDDETGNTVDNNTTSDENYTEKTMYINDSYVNVRKEPNTSSEIVMVLALNTKLTVIGESGDWYKVKTSEGNAYVSKELLSSKQVTTSRGGSSTSHTSVAVTQTSTTKTTTTKTTTSTNTSSSTSKGDQIVAYAKQFLGVPYVYGGASKSGFDCSGFTMYVYKKFGISMAHSAQAQSKLGKAVSVNKKSASSLKENLQPGDLVFFLDYETMDEIGHCGIYIGNGDFIHASSGSGYCVKINSLLPGEYYNTRYCGARRVI